MATREPHSTSAEVTAALTADFTETARTLYSAGSVEDTLAVVLRLAVDTIEGCDFAGLFIVEGQEIQTRMCTDQIVLQLDALQSRTGEGPCLDAVKQGASFYAEDLAEDPRWPHFGPSATASGMRSLLALPMDVNGSFGALNLYARYPRAFGVIDRARGVLLAAFAALALNSARDRDAEERRATDLYGALATREIIGQAQGILIERERLTPDQAFDILRRASQHLNLKLREVARTLVETGEDPDTGPAPRS
jgi:GAF domain-containing protein